MHHARLTTRYGCAHVGFVNGFAKEFSLQGVTRCKVMDAVGVHESCIAPVGEGRGGASCNGEDVPCRHAMGLAEVHDTACHIGCVLIGHLGGAVVCTAMTTRPCGVTACTLRDVTARRCGEEEAHTGTLLADALGEGAHGLGMGALVKCGAMCLVGAKGDDEEIGTLCHHTVDHVLLVEATCPSAIHAVVGELHPREVTLQGAAQGTGQDVALDVGVAYLHHLDGLVLMYLLEDR